MQRVQVTGGVAAVVLALGALLAGRAALDEQELLIVRVVGDSFPEQSRDQLVTLARRYGHDHDVAVDIDVSAFGGTSICSWWDRFDDYRADAPDILVMSFAGNDIHECITDGTDGLRDPDEVAADYREDLETVIEQFQPLGTEIYVVTPPPIKVELFEEHAAAMRQMYHDAQEEHPGLGVIDSASYLDPDDQGFQKTLPCEPWDTEPTCDAEGRVQVRDDDDIHLTPAGGERYARAVLEGTGLQL